MKITDVRLERLHGRLPRRLTWSAERQVGALDLYPEFRARGASQIDPTRAEELAPTAELYVHIDTDAGLSGLFGPLFDEQGFLIQHRLRPYLLGADPLATERLWDIMSRSDRHARRGHYCMALSALDIALWDLRGKAANQPVYRLLGGPTRAAVPAYASTLGFAQHPAAVQERASALLAEGYTAQKWFFRHGPGDGRTGLTANMALVQTLRETVGDASDLMFDAWLGWDVPFAIEMGKRMAPFGPRWLEEPVPPDRLGAYAAIRAATGIPIAGGEHEYTRWGFKAVLDADALDVIQADPDWTGGISEMVKICALASAYGKQVIPHGHSVLPALHVIASQSPEVCPLLEYLLRYNPTKQWFHQRLVQPEGGLVQLPQEPGLGLVLDEAKIERRERLTY